MILFTMVWFELDILEKDFRFRQSLLGCIYFEVSFSVYIQVYLFD